jgi:hypothetical protein
MLAQMDSHHERQKLNFLRVGNGDARNDSISSCHLPNFIRPIPSISNLQFDEAVDPGHLELREWIGERVMGQLRKCRRQLAMS